MHAGVWLSLVERFVRDEEVACSNLVTPTTLRDCNTAVPLIMIKQRKLIKIVDKAYPDEYNKRVRREFRLHIE